MIDKSGERDGGTLTGDCEESYERAVSGISRVGLAGEKRVDGAI
jgi:hypothetical protein